MTGTALVPTFEGRPVFIRRPGVAVVSLLDHRIRVGQHGDVSICIAVHDAYFLRTKAAYRAEILAASRRRGGVAASVAAYARWLARERDWYAAVGLDVPDWQILARPRLDCSTNAVGARRSTRPLCPSGHVMDARNTYRGRTGRKCRACARARHAS